MTQRIMVVDDEDSARLSVELALTMAGYSVVSTADGREAIDKILEASEKSEDFDLLITDLRMPGMSGEQLIDELNALGVSVPKLVISAYSDNRSIRELSLKGCHDYYEKPLNPRTLIDRVGEILKKNRTINRDGKPESRRQIRFAWPCWRPLTIPLWQQPQKGLKRTEGCACTVEPR